MNRIRRYGVRVPLLALATFIALLTPGAGIVVLAVAVAALVHDGDQASARWFASLLVAVEVVSGSAIGTLSVPFCVTVAVLAVARRSLSLTPWSQRSGWMPSDAARAVVTAFVFSVFSWVAWLAFGVLTGVPDGAVRFMALREAIPVLSIMSVVGILLFRLSTEPVRRPIMFASS